MGRLVVLTLLVLVAVFTACEDEDKLAELEEQRDALKAEIEDMETELTETEQEIALLKDFPELQEQKEVQE
ncbi:MAG: hypothetical protein GF403_07625 [Candidatus Coatesbacteria bacterium]|nr:hypothetical protein [Candidatus Coatesbacteria bacterium]